MLLFFRKHIFEYQIMVLILYLAAITFTESMKATLPIYIILSTLPYIYGFKRIDMATFTILAISFVYIAVGLLFQDRAETLISFLSKTYQFVVFMLFLAFAERYIHGYKFNPIKLMKICILVETSLGLYLLTHAAFVSDFGIARITAGRQPVGGNLSIVMIPIVFYSYFRYKNIQGKILVLSLISAVWILLSGTRGYLLLYIMSMAPVFLDYFFSLKRSTKSRLIVRVVVVFAIAIAGIYILLDSSVYLQRIVQMLRLDAGTGSRSNENKIATDFFLNTNLIYRLFGIGYGGIPADAPGFVEAVSSNVTGAWSYANYVGKVGVSFHNLFSNFLLLQGLVGCIEIIIIFCWGWVKLKTTKTTCRNEKRCIYLYWIGFFLMNCFRWSCDCGISEMIIFASVLGLMRQSKRFEKYRDKTVETGIFSPKEGEVV